MKNILDRAIMAMRNSTPATQEVDDAAARVRAKLEADINKVVPHPMAMERISSCADYQALIPAYLTKSLTDKKALLLEDHTRECVSCRNALVAARTYPRTNSGGHRPPLRRNQSGTWRWAAVAASILLIVGYTQMNVIRDLVWPIEVSAIAQTVDGKMYLVSGAELKPIAAGQKIERHQVIRTARDSGAILQLADGSKIEVRERSELSLDRASDGVKIGLDRGSVIVTAAKQRSGHLYVGTDDCTVSVVGTVFSVNTGAKGSRVSVVEGEVHVEHSGASKALLPGQQLSTTPILANVPIEQDIAWSREADIHREMLREALAFVQDLGARMAAEELRYSSNLLNVIPENTVVMAALPNVTESFGQAYDAFRQRILENAVLKTWWIEQNQRQNGPTLDELVQNVRRIGSYLGPEIVVLVPHSTGGNDAPVLIAETTNPEGLLSALPNFAFKDVTIKVEAGLLVISPEPALVNQVLALRRSNAPSAFTTTKLYARVSNAYREGVGWLAAADLERLFIAEPPPAEVTQLGISDAQQLLIEQKTGSAGASFHATLGFNQPRRGMVSWLAQPGPIGALEFVSPGAYGAAAVATKDPSQIVDDLFTFFQSVEPDAIEEINEVQRTHRIDIRRDLAEPLGTEFLFAVDGPILPNPSWKVVVEVYDAARLQNSIEWMISEYNREASAQQQPTLNLTAQSVDGRTFYTVSVPDVPQQIHYTFWTGYLIAAPSRTLLTEAIQYKDTGNSLAKSAEFRAQLPADGRNYVSGFFYQNASSLVPSVAQSVAQMVPTLVCLYGESDRIMMSSKGMLAVNLASLAGIVQQVNPR